MRSLKDYFYRIVRGFGLTDKKDDMSLTSRLANGTGAPAEAADLFQAASRGYERKVAHLLTTRGTQLRPMLNNALALAARHGQTAVVKQLIEAGADVHELDDEPLRWAAKEGHSETVRALLAAGANSRIRDDAALRSALANGHLETAQILQRWPRPN